MANPSESTGLIDRVVLLFLFALLLLVSPLVEIWATDDAPWYLPYLGWAVLIALAARLQRDEPNDDL